jgi:hypothetical protein
VSCLFLPLWSVLSVSASCGLDRASLGYLRMLRLDRAEHSPGLCRQSLSLATARSWSHWQFYPMFNDTDLIDSAYEAGPVDALGNEPFNPGLVLCAFLVRV